MPELKSFDGNRLANNSIEARNLRNSDIIAINDELSGSKDNPHLYIHNLSKPPAGGTKGVIEVNVPSKKDLIGQPYKVKSKLPFYDNKGTFQGSKIG